jgi:hypothetical protein
MTQKTTRIKWGALLDQTQRYTNLLPSQKQEQIQKLVIKIEKPRDAPPEEEQ